MIKEPLTSIGRLSFMTQNDVAFPTAPGKKGLVHIFCEIIKLFCWNLLETLTGVRIALSVSVVTGQHFYAISMHLLK